MWGRGGGWKSYTSTRTGYFLFAENPGGRMSNAFRSMPGAALLTVMYCSYGIASCEIVFARALLFTNVILKSN